MAPQFGRLTTQLVDSTISPTDQYCDQINRRIAPKVAVTPDKIYVGAMFLVSDQVNSFGGRFPADEHDRLAELIVDSPVLVGHRKDSLPIARNFHAELVERSGEKWVKCYFYWLRGSQGAESLKTNIEGGLYKECSIAFTYDLPECSICGEDIRACEHEPGISYPSGDCDSVCHFNYRQIERVLETSFVYRGAVPNTLVTTDDLSRGSTTAAESTSQTNSSGPLLQPIDSLDRLGRDTRYLVVPRYDALPVVLTFNHDQVQLWRFDKSQIELDVRLTQSNGQLCGSRVGLLIGLQGRRRCSRSEVEKCLNDRSSPISRLVVATYPNTDAEAKPAKYSNSRDQLRTLPHRLVPWSELPSAVNAVATRDGVEIWPLGADPLVDTGYHYRALSRTSPAAQLSSTLTYDKVTRAGVLTLETKNQTIRFNVLNLSPTHFASGRRFLADPINEDQLRSMFANCSSAISTAVCDGALLGEKRSTVKFALQPVLLNGRRRWLVYQLSSAAEKGRDHALN